MTEIIKPADIDEWLALRRKDVTASEIGALLGLHDYKSARAMYHDKRGEAEPVAENAAMTRGRLLEPVAVRVLCQEHPDWQVAYNARLGSANGLPDRYWRDPGLRIGCTPDCLVTVPQRRGQGIVQLKSVEPRTFRRNWLDEIDPSIVVPPEWIRLQTITEAKLTGAAFAYVAALVVQVDVALHLVEIPLDEAAEAHWQTMVEAVAAFWQRVEKGEPPDYDYALDEELIRRRYATTRAETVDLSGDNALAEALHERARQKARIKIAEATLTVAETEIRAKMGHASSARCGDWTIRLPTTHRKAYTVAASSFRRLSATYHGPDSLELIDHE